MATVSLTIGGQPHQIACRDGGEARLKQAARLIDERWTAASRGAGGAGPTRTMLIAALMLADALIDAREATPVPTAAESADTALDAIAMRLEALAATLEADALED